LRTDACIVLGDISKVCAARCETDPDRTPLAGRGKADVGELRVNPGENPLLLLLQAFAGRPLGGPGGRERRQSHHHLLRGRAHLDSLRSIRSSFTFRCLKVLPSVLDMLGIKDRPVVMVLI